jgi:hypothetical protein
MARRSIRQVVTETFAQSSGGGGSRSEPSSKDTAKPSGRSGTVNTRGFIQDREVNSALTYPRNLEVYDRMRKTDATTLWMLGLLKGPARAAVAAVDPPKGADDTELEATAFAEHAIFELLDGGFDDFLRRCLTYLEMGHYVGERRVELRTVEFEVTSETVIIDPETQEPKREENTRTVKREAFVITRIEDRLQRTVTKFVPDESDPARLQEVEQSIGDGLTPATPIILVNEKEGDDWRGNSILRSAWRPYEYKSRLENLEAIGYERSVGCPVAYPPDSADEEEIDEVEAALRDLRQGEAVFLVMPGPKQSPNKDGRDGWLVEELAIKGEGDNAPDTAINRYVGEIARNVLAEFMRLGQDGVGARATGDVQQNPYYDAVTAVTRYLENVLNEAVIRPLVDWNYEVKRYPRLRFSKIHANSVEMVAKAVAELINAGAIESTPELEAWLRELLDAPEKPQTLEGRAKPAPPPSPDKPAPGNGPKPDEGPTPGEASAEEMSRERFSSFEPPRALVGGERFVQWDQVKATLDNGSVDLVGIGEQAMQGQIESASDRAGQAVRENRPDDLDHVALDPAPLAEALERELTRLYSTGQADVRAEVRRQLVDAGKEGATGEALATPPNIPLSNSDVAKVIAGIAKNMAETGAQAAVKAIKTRALKTLAARKEAPPAPGEDPMAELRAALRQGATPAVNRIYTLGRMDEIQAQHNAGLVEAVRYSAVLDGAACEVCIGWDGTVVKPELAIPLPNGECDGGDRCRCTWVPELVAPGEVSLG